MSEKYYRLYAVEKETGIEVDVLPLLEKQFPDAYWESAHADGIEAIGLAKKYPKLYILGATGENWSKDWEVFSDCNTIKKIELISQIEERKFRKKIKRAIKQLNLKKVKYEEIEDLEIDYYAFPADAKAIQDGNWRVSPIVYIEKKRK